MTTRWLVAKYIADLRRREPINVGVILQTDEGVGTRFVGQKSDDTIDGRSARAWVRSTANFKRWVEYWQHEAYSQEFDIETLLTSRPDDNYYLEYGGERLIGGEVEPSVMLEQLYTALVETTPSSRQLDIAQLSDNLFDRLAVRAEPFSFDFPLRGGVADRVTFDYRYDNGQPNLFRRVSLTFEDDRSWSFVHAASWAFSRADEFFGGEVQPIALVKPRPDDSELEQQLAVLDAYAYVLDVSLQELAANHLAELLHIDHR